MAFLSALWTYTFKYILLLAVATAGVFAGKAWNDSSSKKKSAESNK